MGARTDVACFSVEPMQPAVVKIKTIGIAKYRCVLPSVPEVFECETIDDIFFVLSDNAPTSVIPIENFSSACVLRLGAPFF